MPEPEVDSDIDSVEQQELCPSDGDARSTDICETRLTVRGSVLMSVQLAKSLSGLGRDAVPGQGRVIKTNPEMA